MSSHEVQMWPLVALIWTQLPHYCLTAAPAWSEAPRGALCSIEKQRRLGEERGTWQGGEEVMVGDEHLQRRQLAQLVRQQRQPVVGDPQLPQVGQEPHLRGHGRQAAVIEVEGAQAGPAAQHPGVKSRDQACRQRGECVCIWFTLIYKIINVRIYTTHVLSTYSRLYMYSSLSLNA